MAAHESLVGRTRMTRVIIGMLVIVGGFLMIWKTQTFYNFIGSIDWAERHFAGGTKAFLKLLGIVVIIFGFIITFNLYLGILGFIFGGRQV